MRLANDYNYSFTWRLRSVTRDATTGQDVESWTDNGILWGKILTDTAVEATIYGSLQSQSTATIRFRQWPTLKATDRLVHRQFGDTYEITGVRRDGTDTIAETIIYTSGVAQGDQ